METEEKTDILVFQFIEKINGSEELSDRLSVAEKVFKSHSIPMFNKEEVVLGELSKLAAATRANERTQVILSLRKCLLSKRMTNFTGDFSPQVVDHLLQVFSLHSSFPEESLDTTKDALIQTAIALLSTSYFQRWFACDVKNLCRLFGDVLSATSESSYNEVVKLMSLLSITGKTTLFKDETRDAFLESTFVPLSAATSLIPGDENDSLLSRVTDTFINVVLYNPGFLEDFCKSKSDVRTPEGGLPPAHNLISSLKSMVKSTSDNKKTLEMCFKIILMSSIKVLKNDQNYELAFDVFTSLCSILGCRVDKKRSISWKAVKNWNHKKSYEIIAEMIAMLDQFDVPLSIDYGTYSLESWFMSLVIGTLSINLSDLSPELLNMSEKVFKYNPLIIENCAKSIADVMASQKPEVAVKPYVSFMKTALDGAFQVQRLQKFIGLLLEQTKRAIDVKSSSKNFDSTSLVDVVPQELSDHFAEMIVMTPNSQILAIFKDLVDHIQNNCLLPLESGSTDITVILMTEVSNELLKQLLLSVKIADHSVPDNVKSKFEVLLHDLKIILQKTINSLVETHNDRLLKSFLDVSHAFGAVNLMIEEYEGSSLKPVTKKDLDPFNFSYVHPYGSPQIWKRIGDSVVDHENCLARQSLYKMMVQKVEAVAQVEEGTEGPGTQTARRLLTIADPRWLWGEVTNLIPLFQADEVVQLITSLVDSFGNDQDDWSKLIKQDEFVENRRLVLALAFQLLTKISESVGDEENGLGKYVLNEIKVSDLLEYELSLLITEDESLTEEISGSIIKAKKVLNDKLHLEMIDNKNIIDFSFIRVLHSLPLHHFSVLSQSCLSLAIIGILGQIPPNPNVDNMLLDILFRILKSPTNNPGEFLIRGLNSGILLKLIALRGGTYPSLDQLIRAICKESLNDRKTAKKIVKAVSKPTAADVWLTTIVIEEINQFKPKKNVADESDAGDSAKGPSIDKDTCLDALVKLVVPILDAETPSVYLLPTYAVVLRLHFHRQEDFGSTTLRSNMTEYLRLCSLHPEKGYTLIDTLIQFKSKLDNEGLRKTIALDGWKLLIKDNKGVKFLSRLKTIFNSCTDEEFRTIMGDLLSQTSNSLFSDNCNELSTFFDLWCPLVSSMISLNKSKSRQEALVSLAKYVVLAAGQWKNSPDIRSVEPILKFFTHLASCTSVEMKPAVLDSFFFCLQAAPLPQDFPDVVICNLPSAIEALFALYLFRNVLVLDRLHVYLPIYKKYLEALARISSPESDYIDNSFLCADKLERVAKTLVKRQKDFSRLAQYIIADVLSILELFPLHSEVKAKYTNIINTFLTLCDEHAISFLSFNLPPASQELFKTLHFNFTKYHKYEGKI